MFKKGLFIVTLLLCFVSQSQSNRILYGFAELPQNLMVNPGAETNFSLHIGMPLLSGINVHAGTTNFTLSDLFLSDGNPFKSKLGTLINKLTNDDYININAQIDLINLGFRINSKTYISLGFYEELHFMSYFPKDAALLAYEGNAAYVNKSFDFSKIRMNGELVGVLHAGVSYKVDKRLTIGGRLKMYSSGFNFHTNNNKGTFTTSESDINVVNHFLRNMNYEFKTSGLYKENTLDINTETILKNTFFGNNQGFGVDMGFTYHLTPQVELTGSVLDLGSIEYSNEVKNTTLKGSYFFDGIEFLYDSEDNIDYFGNVYNDLKDKVTLDTNTESYSVKRPTKVNVSVKYGYGLMRKNKKCFDVPYKEYYNNSVGLQLHTIHQLNGFQFAVTSFFEKHFREKYHIKATYTIDGYSASNVGFGFSGEFGKFNIFSMVDNVFGTASLTSSNTTSFLVGFNFNFKKNDKK